MNVPNHMNVFPYDDFFMMMMMTVIMMMTMMVIMVVGMVVLQDCMLVMGLRESVYWLGWLLTYALMAAVTSTVIVSEWDLVTVRITTGFRV